MKYLILAALLTACGGSVDQSQQACMPEDAAFWAEQIAHCVGHCECVDGVWDSCTCGAYTEEK